MRKLLIFPIILLILAFNATHTEKDKYVNCLKYVDPLIGTKGGGNTFPGAVLPFSVVSVSPDTEEPTPNSGYKSGAPITGFSQTHTSGTGGGGRYGNFSILPLNSSFDSSVKKLKIINEEASPAYYCAVLENDVTARMTLTHHVGYHQYMFSSDSATLVMNVTSGRIGRRNTGYICTDARIVILSDSKIAGHALCQGGWGGQNPHKVHFVAEFDQPFANYGIQNGKFIGANTFEYGINKDMNGFEDMKSWFTFNPDKDSTIQVKIAVSYRSYGNADQFLSEIPVWDFDQIKEKGEKKWNNYLSRIKVKEGNDTNLTILYTGMYHAAIMPRDLSGDNPLWVSEAAHYWDYYCIWDTYRSVNPLLALIDPKRQGEIVASLVDIYEHKGWLSDAWTGGDYASLQGGTNADIVIGEAILKDLPGLDHEKAYKAIKKNAEIDPGIIPGNNGPYYGRFLNKYLKYKYLPSKSLYKRESPPCPLSRSLEYGANDFSIALAAKKLGHKEDYKKYLERSDWTFELFNPETKFFWAKDTNGNWLEGFSPDYHKCCWGGALYEGTPWQYSMSAPHNVGKLIKLHGGDESFIDFLNTIFDDGHYTQENQPDIHMPWLYHYAGRPDLSNKRVHQILNSAYSIERNGLPGNDDSGTMSAWAVLASIGIYPVPGQDIYLLTIPVFDQIEINDNEGKQIHIKVKGRSNTKQVINQIQLNGKNLNRYWLKHKEIQNAEKIVLVLGNQPNETLQNNRPPSFEGL